MATKKRKRQRRQPTLSERMQRAEARCEQASALAIRLSNEVHRLMHQLAVSHSDLRVSHASTQNALRTHANDWAQALDRLQTRVKALETKG